MKKLILMRGVSGSGKSTLAKQLAEQSSNHVIYSTDDFFMVDGQYKFDPKKIRVNHQRNQDRTYKAMKDGVELVIVDNTNTQAWEMKPYVEAAIKLGYEVEIRQPDPVPLEEIMRRQQMREDANKSLSVEIVKKMLDRFEHDVTVEKIVSSKSPF